MFSKEHLITIAIFKAELGYAILSEYGCNLEGQTRVSHHEAEEHYNDLIKDTKRVYHSMEMPFYTTEIITNENER